MATQTNCGGLMYDATTLEVNANKELAVKDGVVAMPIATNAILGGVIPDGTVITVSETGAITVADASTTDKGVILQAENQVDSEATEVAGLVADFNALLLKLKTAGIMEADA